MTTPTITAATLTDEQIEALGRESAEAGDIHGAAIAWRALGWPYDHMALDPSERSAVDAMSVQAARAECARVIADAQAMQD